MNDAFRLALSTTMILLFAGFPAFGDTVRLRNGNSLEGDARVLANGDVEVHSAMGVWTVAAHRVERVVEAPSREEEAATRLLERPDLDADELYRMAAAARAEGSDTLARRLMERALQSDPDHEPTRRDLGFQRHDGRWLTDDEARSARGEVLFRGRWLTPDEHAAMLSLEALEERRRGLEAARRAEQARLQTVLVQQARELAVLPQQPVVEGIPYGSVLGFVGPITVDPRHGRSHPARRPLAPAVTPQRVEPPVPAPAPRVEGRRNRSGFRPPSNG